MEVLKDQKVHVHEWNLRKNKGIHLYKLFNEHSSNNLALDIENSNMIL